MRARIATTGLAAAAVHVATGELVASARPAIRSPVTGLGRGLIDLTPGAAVDGTVALFEAADKPLLHAIVLGDFALRGLAAAALAPRHPRAAAGVLLAQGAVAGTAASRRPDAAGAASLVAGLAGGAAGVAALRVLGRRPALAPLVLAAAGGMASVAHRRNAGVLSARADARKAGLHTEVPFVRGLDIPGLSPVLTPNVDFYETDVTFPPPVLDAAAWRLRVHGRVERELTLSYEELLALGTVELDATLICVHNPVGGPRLGTARWTGVPLRRVLEQVGVVAGADQLLARTVDGFSAGVPLALLDEERPALLATGMNGEPLPFGHGYPVRLLVPGLYGYDANAKWVSELELTTFAEVADYWTARGWPREPARVHPSARIDVPLARSTVAGDAVTVAGVAWAPPTGVRTVEVRVGDGPWQPAVLGEELAPTAWRQWRLELSLPAGEHTLSVRTDGQQDEGPHLPPFPRGARGFHTIKITVAGAAAPPARLAGLGAIAGERVRLAHAGLRAWGPAGLRIPVAASRTSAAGR